jgi:hypothetical protein
MTDESTMKLAKIVRADLGFEDHGIFGFNIEFAYSESLRQGTGWYYLANDHGGRMLEGILKAVGVDRWDQLAGKLVNVHTGSGHNGLVLGFEKLPMESRGGVFLFTEFLP